jgi:hypothetical protein
VINNTYNEAVVNDAARRNVSYNGGPGGATATPTAEERAVAADRRMAATPRQRQIMLQSAGNPELMARTNRTHPVIAATKSPPAVNSSGVVKSDITTAAAAGSARAQNPVHPTTTLHAQRAVERPATRDIAAHTQEEGGSEHPAAPKLTGAKPAKAQHPKQ